MVNVRNEYRHNSKFRQYVDKYSKHHGITVDEALTHELVRQVRLHCTEVWYETD